MDPPTLHKFEDLRLEAGVERAEAELWSAVQQQDINAVLHFKVSSVELVRKDWPFVQAILKEAIQTGNTELVKSLVALLCLGNIQAYQIGEFCVVVATSIQDTQMVMGVLDTWLQHDGFRIHSPLDVVAIAIQATGQPTKRSKLDFQFTEMKELVGTTIYAATVEKNSEILRTVLEWYHDNKAKVGDMQKVNADCILHAALEGDQDQVQLLYSAGFRLGPDTTRRVNKDHLKKIKLFRARASAVYLSVAFQESQDVENDDPMKKCLEYSLQARRYATEVQDFNTEYNEVANKSVDFALGLLRKCTTKHEIQTLLQTKSYRNHHDANFNIAILDGHKEIVAHEKFQQLLHKKWGQRDRVQYGDEIRFNIMWSEMGKLQKMLHFLKQIIYFLLLPVIFLVSTFIPCIQSSSLVRHIMMQSHVPVNRFLYFEISKMMFNLIIFCTLIDKQDVAWYDALAVVWIFSYILEDFRTVHRLYKQGGVENRSKTFRRWLTFRNMYIIITNLIFLVALILRFIAYTNNQCRTSGCSYYENQTAFIGASLWAVAALLTFLRTIQLGLMWRQTGPIIISMTYMIIDVFVFLFIFVIVYISFTLCVVYIYEVYEDNQTTFFNTHKSAFKLFYWTMIRTGNPHFPNIRDIDNSFTGYNSSCILDTLKGVGSKLEKGLVTGCAIGLSGEVGEFEPSLEEGVPYITGNVLWAFYQFIVFIVLLSVLRARMVNTYHRIFREADVQWKFFRASIWWKYLDHNSILPPPFTVIFILHALGTEIKKFLAKEDDIKQAENDDCHERREFNKRYKRLLLTLIQSTDNSWGFNNISIRSYKSIVDCGGD